MKKQRKISGDANCGFKPTKTLPKQISNKDMEQSEKVKYLECFHEKNQLFLNKALLVIPSVAIVFITNIIKSEVTAFKLLSKNITKNSHLWQKI